MSLNLQFVHDKSISDMERCQKNADHYADRTKPYTVECQGEHWLFWQSLADLWSDEVERLRGDLMIETLRRR